MRHKFLEAVVHRLFWPLVRDCAKGADWNSESLSLRCGPLPYTFDHCGKESAESVQHYIFTKSNEGENPDMPIFETFLDVFPVKLLRICGLAEFSLPEQNLQSMLFRGQKSCGVWAVWENDPAS